MLYSVSTDGLLKFASAPSRTSRDACSPPPIYLEGPNRRPSEDTDTGHLLINMYIGSWPVRKPISLIEMLLRSSMPMTRRGQEWITAGSFWSLYFPMATLKQYWNRTEKLGPSAKITPFSHFRQSGKSESSAIYATNQRFPGAKIGQNE